MGRTYASICIDREKVYGIMNATGQSIRSIGKEAGLSNATIRSWLKQGMVPAKKFDAFADIFTEDHDYLKGKSSDVVGPEQTKYFMKNDTHKKEFVDIDGYKLDAGIKKVYGTSTEFVKKLGFSYTSLRNYINNNRIPASVMDKIANAINMEQEELLLDPVEQRNKRDEKVEEVKKAYGQNGESFSAIAKSNDTGDITVVPIGGGYYSPHSDGMPRPAIDVDVSILNPYVQIEDLLARVKCLEQQLAEYKAKEKKVFSKEDLGIRTTVFHMVYNGLGSEGYSEAAPYFSSDVENAICVLADNALGNYEKARSDSKAGYRRKRNIEVSKEEYENFVNDILFKFNETFDSRFKE